MLEKIDLKKKCEGKEYKEKLELEGQKLSVLQRKCKEAGIPVIILFEGFGAAGKGTQINRLIQAMDPRGFSVYTSNRETEEERMRPFLWRFWTKIPARGRFAIFDRSWYRRVLADRFDKITKKEELAGAFRDIISFERQLADDGTVLIKLFLYISQREQKKRFKNLEASKETSWKVTEADWKRNKEYAEYLQMNEEMLERTDTDYAPWIIVEAMDKNYAALKIISTVTARLERELEKCAIKMADAKEKPEAEREEFKSGVLSGVDLSKTLSDKEYKKKLDALQEKLELLHSELYRLRIPVVICFEGWDAAGKGGAIKRLTSHMDPRGYQVNPTSSPNDTEKAHHYLWRFWNNMPKAGHIAIFDRTWYGRVMVERIEGFCTTEEWKRAYQEINEMEEHLTSSGCVVLKFWLHIDKDEQEKRFKERMENPAKQWKITDEDWRNREKWDEYEKAVDEMLVRTSTTYAPWEIVEANSKYYARVKVLETVVKAMEREIDKRR
ncbi:MAG: polyphosphate:AMP phosphotransferase [Lachnospiraceae bacterium]|nr:polyphosphate:AMP phosphotransferase [Lachnospiraceae bacterium]